MYMEGPKGYVPDGQGAAQTGCDRSGALQNLPTKGTLICQLHRLVLILFESQNVSMVALQMCDFEAVLAKNRASLHV